MKRPTKEKPEESKCKPLNHNDLPRFNRFMNEILGNRTNEKTKEGGKDDAGH